MTTAATACNEANNNRLSAVLAMGRPKINRVMNNNNARNRYGYSSQHPGGSMFVLCDGSVRFIAETVEGDFGTQDFLVNSTFGTLTTWEGLLARQDGVAIQIP